MVHVFQTGRTWLNHIGVKQDMAKSILQRFKQIRTTKIQLVKPLFRDAVVAVAL